MNTKHTPGPWHQFGYAIMSQDKDVVCDIFTTPLTGSRDQANAKLIAEAPLMLKALEVALDSMQRAWNDGDCSPACDPEDIETVRAAIARATGDA